ncbi:MAG TPA: aldo/keto reductase, partial [bacterium]|nr:aldo/keto reductase [bacterium]
MNPMHRRSFLKCGLAGAGLLTGFSSTARSLQAAESGATVDQIPLGNTGIQLSRFAMGTGTRGWE